jgi:hypothetical protein
VKQSQRFAIQQRELLRIPLPTETWRDLRESGGPARTWFRLVGFNAVTTRRERWSVAREVEISTRPPSDAINRGARDQVNSVPTQTSVSRQDYQGCVRDGIGTRRLATALLGSMRVSEARDYLAQATGASDDVLDTLVRS